MIRPAREGEAELLRNLVRAAYAHYVPRLGREPAPMTDDYAARIAAGQAWVLEADGTAMGALVLEDTPGGPADRQYRRCRGRARHGQGRRLMDFAETEARRGHPKCWLYTNEKMVENIALYARLGYVETHRAEQHGHRRVFMEKPSAEVAQPATDAAKGHLRPPMGADPERRSSACARLPVVGPRSLAPMILQHKPFPMRARPGNVEQRKPHTIMLCCVLDPPSRCICLMWPSF